MVTILLSKSRNALLANVSFPAKCGPTEIVDQGQWILTNFASFLFFNVLKVFVSLSVRNLKRKDTILIIECIVFEIKSNVWECLQYGN